MMYATQFRWTSASLSDVGLVRQLNEDACLDKPERGIWAVADGMGGHALGDFASNLVIDALSTIPAPDSIAGFVTDVRDQLQTVNQQLRVEAGLRGARIIGSTAVVLLAYDRYCGYLWAGDSRLYLYRNERLVQLTRDHSQLEELKLSGSILFEDVTNHPARNMITRAVGAADSLNIDEEIIEVLDGDIYLLCSDGLSNEVSEQEMRNALIGGNCRLAAEVLIDLALQHGGRDNVSVVVVRADDMASREKTVLNPGL